MKTNQLMTVRLGNFGTVSIGHLTRMGSADEILAIGNQIREEKGLKPKKLDTYLRRKETWEKIIKLYNVSIEEKKCFVNSRKTYNDEKFLGNCPKSFSANAEKVLYTTLEDLPKEKQGRIKYSEVLKNQQLNHIIKIQNRGKLTNRGTWFELTLLLDLATWLDVDLWYEVYSTFVKGKLLEHRDAGGDAFKRLNKAIDTLPDRQPHLKPKGNKGVYINVAKMIREKLAILDTKGYNEDEHDKIVQEKREEYISTLIKLIEMGFVTSYPQLKETIKKL